MVLVANVLFVGRKKNSALLENENRNSVKLFRSGKQNETKNTNLYEGNNFIRCEDNKQIFRSTQRKNFRSKSKIIKNPKSLILQLTLIKHKTFKCLRKLKNIFKTNTNFKRSDEHNNYDIYDLSNARNEIIFEDEILSREISLTKVWKEEWDTCRDACARCQSFVFDESNSLRLGLERSEESNLNSVYDWSRDSVFLADPESEDFYSALGSCRESPVKRYETESQIEEEEEDIFQECRKGNVLNIFLEAGYDVKDLLRMGCDIQDLFDIGCQVKDLLEADCSIKDLLKVGFSVGDLIQGGCKVENILSSINDKQMLLDVGYSVQELMQKDNRVEELLAEKPEKQLELQRRLQAGETLYPGCDVSVWLRSCKKEILEPLTGITKGKIPNWLKGTLLRNGPGSLQVGNENFQHLFDGSALIHRFGIENGEVKYQCKFVETNTFKKNHAAQRIIVTEFGTAGVPDPCQSIFHRISVLFNPGEMLSDNANISVYPFGDEFYAFAENSVVHRIDPQTLDSVERVNVSKHVNIVNHTSHPHVENGDVYNIGISLSCTGPCYSVMKFPPPVYADNNGEKRKVKSPFEQAQIVASVPARWKLNPSYMHTFGITENYFVIVEQPLSISFTTMLQTQLNNQPMAPCLKWQSNEQTRIHLLNRETGKPVANFLTDPFFYLHIINQYEENGHLVLDISCYKDANMLDCMYIKALQEVNKNINYAEMFRGRPLRFVLPLSPPAKASWGTNLVTLSGSKATAYRFMDNNIFVCPELICDLGCETPRIYYEKHVGKPYRYFYAISSDVDLDNPGTLIKVDTVQKITKTWCEDNIFPSEPVFVPSPNTKSEDDGVVLSAMIWTNGMENKVGLLVLDAVTWTELGRTEFITPSPVPKCLHGWFTNNC